MKRISLILILALAYAFTVQAQTDTTRVEVTEESAEESDFNLRETYNYLIRAQVEERSLFKLGVHSFGFGSHSAFLHYSVAAEHKLDPSFSVLGEVRHVVSNRRTSLPQVTLSAGGRYYYNLSRRIRLGKSANNFSANYLGIYQLNKFEKEEGKYQYTPGVVLVYGLQRRIGKYGYVDLNIGPGYEFRDRSITFIVRPTVSLGLAF